SLHPRAARRGAGARPDGRGGAQLPAGQGRDPEPDQPAVPLRVPSALPARRRGVQADAAPAARAAGRALGGGRRRQVKAQRRRVGEGGEMVTRASVLGAGLGILLAAVASAPLHAAETPKKGGHLTFMIPADAPPSFDGHRETTFAMIHPTAPFYSTLVR